MRLLFSAFTGYNLRELLLPLAPLLTRDHSITQVQVITPAASVAASVFPDLGDKFAFIDQQTSQNSYEKILRRHRPNAVVTPTNGLEPRDIPLINAAKKIGIPTLTFIASWDNVYKIERRVKMRKYQKAYALPDFFAVWNYLNRDHLFQVFPALKTEQVTIVGAPRLDYLVNSLQLPNPADLLAALRIPNDGKKLVHVATTELYPSDYILKALVAARGQKLPNDFNLLVSVHPGGNKSVHDKYAAPLGAHVAYSFGRQPKPAHQDFVYAPTLHDIVMHAALFKHADLLINHSSTVTIESIIADTPVINVKYGRALDWWRWYRSMVYRDFKQHAKIIIDSQATRVVNNRHQLLAETANYLSHPKADAQERAELAKTMITFNDGRCSGRLLDQIKKITHVSDSS